MLLYCTTSYIKNQLNKRFKIYLPLICEFYIFRQCTIVSIFTMNLQLPKNCEINSLFCFSNNILQFVNLIFFGNVHILYIYLPLICICPQTLWNQFIILLFQQYFTLFFQKYGTLIKIQAKCVFYSFVRYIFTHIRNKLLYRPPLLSNNL